MTGETIPERAYDRTATNRAILLMTASAALFGLMAFAAKVASARLSGPQVAMQGLSSWKTPLPSEWVALAFMSLFAIGAQLLLTFSLRWLDALTVGVISQLAVLVSMAPGATLLREMIVPMAAIGSALAISGVIGVVFVTSVNKRPVDAAVVN